MACRLSAHQNANAFAYELQTADRVPYSKGMSKRKEKAAAKTTPAERGAAKAEAFGAQNDWDFSDKEASDAADISSASERTQEDRAEHYAAFISHINTTAPVAR